MDFSFYLYFGWKSCKMKGIMSSLSQEFNFKKNDWTSVYNYPFCDLGLMPFPAPLLDDSKYRTSSVYNQIEPQVEQQLPPHLDYLMCISSCNKMTMSRTNTTTTRPHSTSGMLFTPLLPQYNLGTSRYNKA